MDWDWNSIICEEQDVTRLYEESQPMWGEGEHSLPVGGVIGEALRSPLLPPNQPQHLAVSVEAPCLPELRKSDKRDLLIYLDQVRRYNRQAESWRSTRGVECAPINHLERIDPDILRGLLLQGIDVNSHDLIEQWLVEEIGSGFDELMSLDKEALLNSKLRWRSGATDVRNALIY